MTDRLVPSAYADIAAALAVAVSGDSIILEAAGSPFTGANNRGITPAINNIILKGATGDPADVIVNLQFANRFLSAGASTDWTVKDLSVINGQVNGPGAFEVLATAARWKIDNVLINNCRALTGYGGAIHLVTGGVPGCELTNLIICACQAVAPGGAIRHVGGAALLKNILMVNNFTLSDGGALSLEDAEDSTYEYLTFLTNASTGADGGGLGINGAAEGLYTFWNCIWWENDAAGFGDQIYTRAPSLGVDLKYCLCTDVFNAIIGACTYSNRLLFDPQFAGGVAPDNAHLSQIASGQASDSDCLDSGSETAAAAGLDTRSTRTDGQTDIGQVDRGFHYYTDEPPPPPDHTVTFTTDGTPGAAITGTNPQVVSHGGNCTPVQANAPLGHHFTAWTLLGVPYSVANPLTVLNVTADMTLQANFALDAAPGFIGPSMKQRSCLNCDHFQTYSRGGIISAHGECRAHPPGKCCPALLPASNNWPQIDLLNGLFWCDEWKRQKR
jgi:hypothetical protein